MPIYLELFGSVGDLRRKLMLSTIYLQSMKADESAFVER